MIKRIFPKMEDRPENGMFVAVALFGLISFFIMPAVVAMFGSDVWENTKLTAWPELIYHLLNGVIAAAMFKSYLEESFFNVQLYTKRFLKTVAVASLLMVTIALELYFGLHLWMGDTYPINELSITVTSGLMVQELPLWGTLCHTIVAPFAIAGMFYATGFAIWSCKKPWLGYLIVPIVLLIPGLLDINWRVGNTDLVLFNYFLQLPIHLIACWAYQKADTIWAPITCLAIFNLATSILCLLPI